MARSKAVIRLAALDRREALSSDERKAKGEAIRERLWSLEEFKRAKCVLFYASFRSEVETLGMIADALRDGKRVMVPKVEASGLTVSEINGLGELSKGYMGIPEPSGDKAGAIGDADLIVLPGAAFDESGNRLGYGRGYYDKLLSGTKGKVPLIALAFDVQVTESVPSEAHDIKVDAIVTEKRVIWTGKR